MYGRHHTEDEEDTGMATSIGLPIYTYRLHFFPEAPDLCQPAKVLSLAKFIMWLPIAAIVRKQ